MSNHRCVDVSTVHAIHKLSRQNARLKEQLHQSDAYQLMKEIEQLEAEDKELECIVDNLHKEVDQVVRAAKRLQHVAAVEHNEALEKVSRAKLCIQTIIEEEGDFLSDPDAFVASYWDRLDRVVDKLEEDLGATASFMQIDETSLDESEAEPETCPLAALNNATRRRLLVQVEIERVNEEIRAELEYSALLEPVSHPILDFEDDIDAEADVLESLETDMKQQHQHQQQQQQQQKASYLPEVYASNKHTNMCIQNAVSNLTAQVAK